jgi:hypothetical protein
VQAHEQARELRPRREAVEVGAVHRGRTHPYEHLVAFRLRLFDLPQLDDIDRPVALAQCGPHI